MTLEELIKQKEKGLEDAPTRFEKAVARSQKEIFVEIIALLDELEKRNGEIVISTANLEKIDTILDKMKEVFYGSDYIKAVKAFASDFDSQAQINRDIVAKSFERAEFTSLSEAILKAQKQQAVELLVGSSIDSEFFTPIKETITNSVSSGAPLKDLIKEIRTIAEGDEDKGGKLQRHAQQIASDSFSTADRAYTKALGDEIGAEWFRYVGGTIEGSRAFCIERNGNYYHRTEIEGWGEGKTCCGLKYPFNGKWDGMARETNSKTIFLWLGGYNCQHSIIPVTEAKVPKEIRARVK